MPMLGETSRVQSSDGRMFLEIKAEPPVMYFSFINNPVITGELYNMPLAELINYCPFCGRQLRAQPESMLDKNTLFKVGRALCRQKVLGNVGGGHVIDYQLNSSQRRLIFRFVDDDNFVGFLAGKYSQFLINYCPACGTALSTVANQLQRQY